MALMDVLRVAFSGIDWTLVFVLSLVAMVWILIIYLTVHPPR